MVDEKCECNPRIVVDGDRVTITGICQSCIAQSEKRDCVHDWAHIEDHHVICKKCKHTADLCWTCESEKTPTRDGGLVCLKCNPQ